MRHTVSRDQNLFHCKSFADDRLDLSSVLVLSVGRQIIQTSSEVKLV